MIQQGDGFHTAVQSLKERWNPEEMETYQSTTLEDVQRIISRVQSRQDIERTLIDWTRVQPFLDKMSDLGATIHALPDAVTYMGIVWGFVKAICSATSQDQKALDILLDAFEELGNAIPVIQEQRDIFRVHPALWKVLELIYQEVLQFLEHALTLSTHPSELHHRIRSTGADSHRSAHRYTHVVQVDVERLCTSLQSNVKEHGSAKDIHKSSATRGDNACCDHNECHR